jgi:hypothetical protein
MAQQETAVTVDQAVAAAVQVVTPVQVQVLAAMVAFLFTTKI